MYFLYTGAYVFDTLCAAVHFIFPSSSCLWREEGGKA